MDNKKVITETEVEIVSITDTTADKLSKAPAKSNFFITDILVKEKELIGNSYLRGILNGNKIMEIPTIIFRTYSMIYDEYGNTTMRYPEGYCGLHFDKKPEILTNTKIEIMVDGIPEDQIVIWKIDLDENIQEPKIVQERT